MLTQILALIRFTVRKRTKTWKKTYDTDAIEIEKDIESLFIVINMANGFFNQHASPMMVEAKPDLWSLHYLLNRALIERNSVVKVVDVPYHVPLLLPMIHVSHLRQDEEV